MKIWMMAATGAALTLGACAQEAATPTALSGDALLARGEYLVEGVVLCGDCHTPRVEGGMEPDLTRRLQGSVIPMPPPLATVAPPLAGLPANYTEEQFIAFLQTGVRPNGTHPMPPMPPYRLNEEDARAVSAYIASLPQAAE